MDGYDSNSIIERAELQGVSPVIPPKKNRKAQRDYDKDLYKARHLVENTFLYLKQWRGIATRYAKTQHHFWPLFRSDVCSCGKPSRDYIV